MTITREFDAKQQLVWDCYTKAELLDQWSTLERLDELLARLAPGSKS
jgi:uncharacterized protein YndB with AHSA1/START domain